MAEREGGRREGEEKRREGARSSLFADDDARTVLHSEGPVIPAISLIVNADGAYVQCNFHLHESSVYCKSAGVNQCVPRARTRAREGGMEGGREGGREEGWDETFTWTFITKGCGI